MFLRTTRSGYDASGQQTASGWFMVLMQREGTDFADWKRTSADVRVICRYVRLEQCGHWMMGRCKVKGHRFTLSGTYGGDGMPRDVPEEVWKTGVPLPPELYEAWAQGNGWNGAGSEGPAMHKWGLETFGDKIRNGKRR